MEKKTCPVCQQEKTLGEFYRSKNRVHSWCKKCLCKNQNRRWVERKIEAIKLFGSKCCRCGYCKNYTALEFHHLDPKEKDFIWTKLRELPWAKIVEELKKCILLCANCHRETHWPDANVDRYKEKEILPFINREMKPSGSCPNCGTDVYKTKYCSVECSSISKRKVKRPSKKKLQKLMSENAMVKIASMYGVSDQAIRKWARGYELL